MKHRMRMLWMLPMALALSCCNNANDGPAPLSSETFEQALSILQAQFRLGSAEARANCLEALQVSRDPRVVDALALLIGLAIYALWRLGDESHVSELGQLIVATDPGVRANTALVLGKMGESSIVLLDRYRDDPDIRVRFAITAALARLGNPTAIAPGIVAGCGVFDGSAAVDRGPIAGEDALQ